MQDRLTGKVAAYRDDYFSWRTDEEGIAEGCYIWSDGNFMCDCNRVKFFAQVAEADIDPDSCEFDCDSDRIKVLFAVSDCGRVAVIDTCDITMIGSVLYEA